MREEMTIDEVLRSQELTVIEKLNVLLKAIKDLAEECLKEQRGNFLYKLHLTIAEIMKAWESNVRVGSSHDDKTNSKG